MADDGRWIDELFAAIDRKDAVAFAGFLAPDASFRFGNLPAVVGRDAIIAFVGGFFGAVQGVRHRLEDRWRVADATIVTGNVTYTRHDGSTLSVPFANVMKSQGGGIRDYIIFVDNSALFAPAAA
jgi:ketosteroid isomerase-like protein